MTKYTFKANGKGRKAFVAAIGEITGIKPKYLALPTYAYEIGQFTVEKDGTLVGECDMNMQFRLAEYGFELDIVGTAEEPVTAEAPAEPVEETEAPEEPNEAEAGPEPEETSPEIEVEPEPVEASPETETEPEPEEASEPEPDAPDRLTIEYPLKGITDAVLDNIRKMVAAKEPLLKAALGAEELPIFLTPNTLKFPWFTGPFDEDTAHDYAQFIACLCETAKKKKRVTAQPINTDNARFSMRVWLISLGMIGPEYDGIRKRLVRPLPGDSGWRFGKPVKTEVPAVEPEAVHLLLFRSRLFDSFNNHFRFSRCYGIV